MDKEKRYIKYFLVLFLFTYIFDLPFFRIGTQVIIELISAGFILIYCFVKREIRINRYNLKLLWWFAPFIVYITIMLFVNYLRYPGNFIAYWETYFLFIKFFLRTIDMCIFVYIYRAENNLDDKDYLDILVKVSVVQILFVFLTFIVPQLKNQIFYLIHKYTDSYQMKRVTEYISTRRGFGFSSNLFDSFGYILSLLAIIAFVKGIEKKEKKYFLLVVLLIFSAFLNSRTGFILAVFGFLAILLYYGKNLGMMKTFLKAMLIIVPISLIVFFLIDKYSHATVEWVLSGLEEIKILLFKGEKIGTFEGIQGNVSWPPDILFGVGAAPEYIGAGYTDSGYFQCVWRYGILGTFLLLGSYLGFFMQASRSNMKKRGLAYGFFVIFVIYLYKIYSIGNMGGNLIIFTTLSSNFVRNARDSK